MSRPLPLFDPRAVPALPELVAEGLLPAHPERLTANGLRHLFADPPNWAPELLREKRYGEREPVRVTYTGGFDGLPVFTPAGDQIAWTSSRTPGKDAQIFFGEWDHEAALAAAVFEP